MKHYVLFFLMLLSGIFIQCQNPTKVDADRVLRYQPDGTDFVINNGTYRFNRAIYGTNTGFRVEAGDLPEFAMYLPGMGGNLRFGLIDSKGSKWIIDANDITARYRPGTMIYTISDPMLDKGSLQITVLALAEADGMIVEVASTGIPEDLSLFLAYGGFTGSKKGFYRDGDMGADPESVFYLNPEYCENNIFEIAENSFVVHSSSEDDKARRKRARNFTEMMGVFPAGVELKVSDATRQNTPLEFYSSNSSLAPALTGKVKLSAGDVEYLMLANPKTIQMPKYNQLASLFTQAESKRAQIAGRIQLNTPDAYWNTVGGALSIAADAIWEDPAYLHGAIVFRGLRLNGWRGAYAADYLGWKDRAKRHFSAYAEAQYLEQATSRSIPDANTNLARQEKKKGNSVFSEGYISRNPARLSPPHHYDMNLIYIDQLIRHFDWSGDTAYVRQMWPTIERHLSWEKRNFDTDANGLYDAHAAIWASDALQYSGGEVTHSSSYNYFANKKLAHLAKLIGKDPKPYQTEANLILKALNRELWLPEKGWFAENKDFLGLQKIHTSAALWTVYHAIDSEVTDPFQAWQCLRYIDTEIPQIPVEAEGVSEDYYTLPTTNWMPYTWSINNVAMGEVFHTALAYWQCGRYDEAFKMAKGSLLDFMFLGRSPGNFGQLSYYDAYRGETYRDFADIIGVASRVVVEGLFGVRPDGTNGKFLIQPGLPSAWNYATLNTPDIFIDFKRVEATDIYTVEPKSFSKLDLTFRVQAQSDRVKSVVVNGKPTTWTALSETVGKPVIEINLDAAEKREIRIEWAGGELETSAMPEYFAKGENFALTTQYAEITGLNDPQHVLLDSKVGANALTAKVAGELGARTAFVKLKQGDMAWWMPLNIQVRSAIEIVSDKTQPAGMLEFTIRNNTPKKVTETIVVNGFQTTLDLDARSESAVISIPEKYLNFGSNLVTVTDGKAVYTKNVVNWKIQQKENTTYETVDLFSHFNDKVSQIFKNKYLTPRSPSPTLALPIQGIGDWCSFAEIEEIDDEGLRAKAGSSNRIVLPQGVPFATPGQPDVSNILFTSQWDNYPNEAGLPLSGNASHVYLLMAGSTHHMQSRFDNGEVIVEYTDGTSEKLVLRNPETWWPIEQDYYDDGLAFNPGVPQPVRIHLKTGDVRTEPYQVLNENKTNKIEGGAATVLDLPLDKNKTLHQLRLNTLANDVVIGLMAVTLVR